MNSSKRRRSRVNGAARSGVNGADIVQPTPERYRADHVGGVVVRCEQTIKDANGGIGRPWRALDTLARMERAGTISRSMRAAGSVFNQMFNEAGLDPLWAADPTRIPVLATNGQISLARRGSRTAAEMVFDALLQLGGVASPGGSCAWHILGCEMTIESWALSRGWGTGRVDARIATGILLTDLGILQTYYSIP
ncbi:MAG TPA: hypothetical protein VGF39_04135 [Stellaceae bacterium]|jgi:hypothetical protein